MSVETSTWLRRLREDPEKYSKAMKLARLTKDKDCSPLVKMIAKAELYDLMAPFINPGDVRPFRS